MTLRSNKTIAAGVAAMAIAGATMVWLRGADSQVDLFFDAAVSFVSGTVALMLSKDATLNPASVKARLMRSARKIAGDPTQVGSGVLDVVAALADTGRLTGQALSPLLQQSSSGSVILIEGTAKLWGNAAWVAGYLWSNGFLWQNSVSSADGVSRAPQRIASVREPYYCCRLSCPPANSAAGNCTQSMETRHRACR